MISNEAVEAAVRASYLRSDWADENNRKFIKRALEAAAPHMLAAAWEEGMRWADTLQSGQDLSDNPYRSQA